MFLRSSCKSLGIGIVFSNGSNWGVFEKKIENNYTIPWSWNKIGLDTQTTEVKRRIGFPWNFNLWEKVKTTQFENKINSIRSYS